MVRTAEEGDTVMAEIVGRVSQRDASVRQLSMAEVLVSGSHH
ncbi:hypothetical protein [Geodermatophilus sp. SYSU D01176]